MPELTPQELNVAVAKALNLHIEGGNERRNERSWYLMREDRKVVATLSRYSTAVIKDEETAFEFLCPKFATSLDACKPLIDEMYNSKSVDIFGLDWGMLLDSRAEFRIFMLGLPHNRASLVEESNAENFIEAAAVALCRAYLKFKELTTKEETNG